MQYKLKTVKRFFIPSCMRTFRKKSNIYTLIIPYILNFKTRRMVF